MPFLVIKNNGNPVVILMNETIESIPKHIRNGYPRLIDALNAGHITGEVVSDASGITLSALPVTDAEIKEGMLRILLEDRFELENRIRVLEGKPPLTAQAFKDALKAKLGL